MKKCTICKLEKNFSQFFKHKHTKDGFGSLCKDCLKIRGEQKRREKGILPRRKGLDPHKIKLRKQKFTERRKHKTFPEISEKCLKTVGNYYDWKSWDLVIEPSAGNGSFLNKIPIDKKIGIDIFPRN